MAKSGSLLSRVPPLKCVAGAPLFHAPLLFVVAKRVEAPAEEEAANLLEEAKGGSGSERKESAATTRRRGGSQLK
eukprot:8512834-Pyramimonas_sp.AAC.1